MEQLRLIDVSDNGKRRYIELYHGDLTRIPSRHAVDFLIVSAFQGDYTPTSGSLIGSLAAQGLSVTKLAEHKEHDLRPSSGFWLSEPLADNLSHLNIKRIVCFEPSTIGPPPEVVGSLFRGLFPFLGDGGDLTVAMPLLATGDMGWPSEEMLVPLLEAAYQWMSRGLPITRLMIVEKSANKAEHLAMVFDDAASRLRQPLPPQSPIPPLTKTINRRIITGLGGLLGKLASRIGTWGGIPVPEAQTPEETPRRYDVFISYSSVDADAAEILAASLNAKRPGISIFDFRSQIDKGAAWQQAIDDAITHCQRVIAIMSPDYFASVECTEEIMMARLRNKRARGGILHPVYWRSLDDELALWLQIINYSDCREQNRQKIDGAATALTDSLGS